jgi:hypothetical protein
MNCRRCSFLFVIPQGSAFVFAFALVFAFAVALATEIGPGISPDIHELHEAGL